MSEIRSVTVPVGLLIGDTLGTEIATMELGPGDSFQLVLADTLEAIADQIRADVVDDLVDEIESMP